MVDEDTRLGRADRAVRMLDVASRAGVSRTTVSNVMRGLASVAPEVRQRVLEAADGLGYIYNRGAASLRNRQSNLVGLVIPDIANPFIAEAVRGAQAALSARGYLVTTIETADDVGRQALVLKSLAEHRVDGFIVIPAIGSDPASVSLHLGGLPTVALNRDVQIPGAGYTGPDEPAVARCGIEHLIDVHGCSEVAYFGGPEAAGPRRDRLDVQRDYARARGVDFVEAWSVPCEATSLRAYELARRLVARGSIPAGVQCHSDTIAYGLLRALREAGIGADECRVVGCDDLPESPFFSPAVTSTSVDASIIGRSAAEQLLERMGETVEPSAVPAPRLVVRESCGCVPASTAG